MVRMGEFRIFRGRDRHRTARSLSLSKRGKGRFIKLSLDNSREEFRLTDSMDIRDRAVSVERLLLISLNKFPLLRVKRPVNRSKLISKVFINSSNSNPHNRRLRRRVQLHLIVLLIHLKLGSLILNIILISNIHLNTRISNIPVTCSILN